MKTNFVLAGIAGVTAVASLVTIAANTTNAADTTTTNTRQTVKTTMLEKGFKHGMKGERPEGFMGHGGGGFGMGMFNENTAMATALKENNYDAFVAAWEADTHKPSDATAPTQEMFAKMVTQYAKQQAREEAIKNNDYNAYVAAITPTQEEFTAIVTEYTTRQAERQTTNTQ